MNLHALDYINKNCVEVLEQASKDSGVNEAMIKGVALFAVANGYDKLSQNQKYHFDETIRPLIENVQCSGFYNPYSGDRVDCSAILPDENLIAYYGHDETYCESCQSEADYMANRREQIERE